MQHVKLDVGAGVKQSLGQPATSFEKDHPTCIQFECGTEQHASREMGLEATALSGPVVLDLVKMPSSSLLVTFLSLGLIPRWPLKRNVAPNYGATATTRTVTNTLPRTSYSNPLSIVLRIRGTCFMGALLGRAGVSSSKYFVSYSGDLTIR